MKRMKIWHIENAMRESDVLMVLPMGSTIDDAIKMYRKRNHFHSPSGAIKHIHSEGEVLVVEEEELR